MNTILVRRRSFTLLAAAGIFLPAWGAAARADTTIVTEVKTTGRLRQGPGRPPRPDAPPPPDAPPGEERPPQPPDGPPSFEGTRAVTTYYKGDKVRVEVENGPVTLYDFAANKVYHLRPERKTYSVRSLKRMAAGDRPGPPADRMPAEAKLSVQAKDATKRIADREAQKYVVTGTVRMVPNFEDRPGGFGGRFPGGGPGGPGGFPPGRPGDPGRPEGFPPGGGPGDGFPGGPPPPPNGGPGRGGPRGGMPMPGFKVEGEYWMSGTIAGLTDSSGSKTLLLPLFTTTTAPGMMTDAILKPLMEKLAKTKGIPLASKVTIRMQRPPRPEEDDSDEPEPLVIITEVKSISEAALDDALFAVPDDYKKAAPGRPMPPRPRPGE